MSENKELEINDVVENENEVVYHSKSNRLPTLTKKEKKELGIGKDEGRAVLKYVRISSRKVRIVNNLIRNTKYLGILMIMCKEFCIFAHYYL